MAKMLKILGERNRPLQLRRIVSILGATTSLLWFAACAHSGLNAAPGRASAPKPTLILVSLDGFRADYFGQAPTPNLNRLIESGVRAKALIPEFPTQTAPNHFSIVTGEYPEQHGIVANSFYDPVLKRGFKFSDPVLTGESVWWNADPIWITAEKNGIKTAPMFWVGSQAEISGVRPTYWKPFSGQVSSTERVRQLLEWIDLPEPERPRFLTLYLDTLDEVGHRTGPDSPETKTGIETIDASVGELLHGLDSRGIFNQVDIIVVSDHGMMGISDERTIFLEDYIPIDQFRISQAGPFASITPVEGQEQAVYKALSHAHPKMKAYRKNEIPKRLHYRNNPRIAPILLLAEPGWMIFDSREKARKKTLGGSHGWAPTTPELYGIFVAHGPDFKTKVITEAFPNIFVHPLMMDILGLKGAKPSSKLARELIHQLRSDKLGSR